jgi:hypothetical protein
MKNPIFIASVFLIAGACLGAGCSSSTSNSTGPTTPSGSLEIPTSINFGNTSIGVCANPVFGAPRDSIISIQNTGTDTLRIHSATPQGTQFTVVSLDSVIPPSGSGPIKLQFCPSALSNASGTLLITSNATQDSSLTVTLTGNGVPYSPGLGSQYNYSVTTLDASGNPTSAPIYNIVDTVIKTGITYQDSSNVSESSNPADSTFYITDNDGDVSIYTPGYAIYPTTLPNIGSGWQTLPYGSHNPNIYSFNKTYNDSAGLSVTLIVSDTATYLGPSTTTIGGISIQESHVHVVESGLYSDVKGSRTFETIVDSYFSPDLGTIVTQSKYSTEVVTVAGVKPGAPTGGGTKINLTSFKVN